MFDVLAKACTSPLLAQQLDWPKRVSMALDAAKVSINLHTFLHSHIGLVCRHHETAFGGCSLCNETVHKSKRLCCFV